MALGSFGSLLGSPTSLILAIVARSEKDPVKKKKLNRIALWVFLAPILLTVISATLWGIRGFIIALAA